MRITRRALLGAAAILAGCAGSPVPGADTGSGGGVGPGFHGVGVGRRGVGWR